MIRKVIGKYDLLSATAKLRDLKYWLSRPPAERVAAVDFLRKQYHGSSERLQRSVRVI